ncbi:MAG: 50S ribosomal protein L18 [Oligosphaeraceae bacterium]|nr:50S ribosomal protein L18 [Oligosphaeraceae bacterium]
MSKLTKKQARIRRHRRLRQKVSGSSSVPRLCVYRSGKHIYAQIIDDEAQRTLVSASTLEKELRSQGLSANVNSAGIVGRNIAERAIAANLKKIVFDRGGHTYHGCVKALADAARETGLEF